MIQQEKAMQKKYKLLVARIWKNWIKPLLVIIVVLGSIRSTIADWNDVPTGSMKPTILEGDRIFVNKLAYDLKVPFTRWRIVEWGEPQRGDVVICYSPENEIRLVKRVVGLPGDVVEMRNNRLIINGKPLQYEKLKTEIVNQIPAVQQKQHHFAAEKLGSHKHAVMLTPTVPAPRSFESIVVPAGQYLVLGDNRDQSRDSRFFGFVPYQDIVGRAVGVALSFDRSNYYAPRWSRFFKGLD